MIIAINTLRNYRFPTSFTNIAGDKILMLKYKSQIAPQNWLFICTFVLDFNSVLDFDDGMVRANR